MSDQKKKWGQVFLHDPNIIRKIVQHATIGPAETILEIGVGKGILTERLAPLAKMLWLVELDPNWLKVTLDKVQNYSNIQSRQSDILDFDMRDIGTPCKVIANIPYYLSAKIIQYLVTHRDCLTGITLMVQKEFAQKLLARPSTKIYGSLSVFFQHYFEVQSTFEVSRNCFYPKPKVDSWVLTAKIKPADTLYNRRGFERFVRAIFHHRRKSIRNNIGLEYENYDQTLLPHLVDEIPLHTVRADSLRLADFITIYEKIWRILGE